MSDSPDTLEVDLIEFLNELSNVQSELLEVLQSKCQFMAHNDLEQLTDIQPRVATLTDRLQNCQAQRTQLLSQAAEHGIKVDTLEELAKRVEPDQGSTLRREIRHAAARTRLLRHQSLANWVLAQASLLHVSQLLEIIATGGRLQPTYSNEERSACNGALVDSEA